jgi:hypothetical protein
MKSVYATTLALALAAGTAHAESHSAAGAMDGASDTAMDTPMTDINTMDRAELIRSRDITGGDIYTMGEPGEWSADTEFAEIGEGWNDIGEIEDVVLTRDGKVKGIVAEIGGFLDIGDKHVMINVEDMKLVPVDDRSFAYVTRLTEEELEQMEGVDEGFWD